MQSGRAAIRVLVADDHAVVREGLRALIGTVEDMQLVGEAADGAEAVSLALALGPDVILLDLMMPNGGGVRAIRQILSERPDARILVLSSFSEDDLVLAAIQAGAQGYLLKESSQQELMRAIYDVHAGKTHLYPSLTARLVRQLQKMGNTRPKEEPLSDREVEVLRLVARGLSNQDIAVELSISENTAAKHVGAILEKLGLANRTQAALYALRQGIARLYASGEK